MVSVLIKFIETNGAVSIHFSNGDTKAFTTVVREISETLIELCNEKDDSNCIVNVNHIAYISKPTNAQVKAWLI